jgi:hypothetical protein
MAGAAESEGSQHRGQHRGKEGRAEPAPGLLIEPDKIAPEGPEHDSDGSADLGAGGPLGHGREIARVVEDEAGRAVIALLDHDPALVEQGHGDDAGAGPEAELGGGADDPSGQGGRAGLGHQLPGARVEAPETDLVVEAELDPLGRGLGEDERAAGVADAAINTPGSGSSRWLRGRRARPRPGPAPPATGRA